MLEMPKLGQSVNNVSCNLKRVAISCFGQLSEAPFLVGRAIIHKIYQDVY